MKNYVTLVYLPDDEENANFLADILEDKHVDVHKFEKTEYKLFFESLMGIKIKEFEEKPFTLQDYFMSFYKEEKEFGGLEGVKGNKK